MALVSGAHCSPRRRHLHLTQTLVARGRPKGILTVCGVLIGFR
jgi:hypothetical protein